MSQQTVPKHVGIIMDGNRRWARERGVPTLKGHQQGQQTLHRLAHYAFEHGVEVLSVYAFSTENWRRAEEEVGYLMKQVAAALRHYIDEFVDEGVRIRFLGSRTGLDKNVLKAIEDAESKTVDNDKATLAVCFNYGGQQEIVDAAKSIMSGAIDAADITPEAFSEHLYHSDIPPIDLLIRTGGEQRLSNFMLWRAAYAELAFTDTYWPDFSDEEFGQLLEDYATRSRRFGK
jgi:undecaprenyl diphosphate synthase